MLSLEIYRSEHIIATFEILKRHCSSISGRREHLGLNRRPHDQQSNALPQSFSPASANLCFAFLRNGYENALSRNIQIGTHHCHLRNPQKTFLFNSRKKTPGLNRRPLERNSSRMLYHRAFSPRQRTFALLSSGTVTKMLCLEIYRSEHIITTFEILKKTLLFNFRKKRTPGFEQKTSRSAVECSTTELFPPRQRTFALLSLGTDTKMLCLEIYRSEHIIATFEILKKTFLFNSRKKRTPGFERKTSRSAVECSTTKLFPPRQRTFALLSLGTDTKMLCLEIYRSEHIIATFEILKEAFSSIRRRGHPGLNRRPLEQQSNALPQSFFPRVSETLLCFPQGR
ncbi:hypothetical protein TNCV_4579511 [Trichonephila clavipes]|nr:hypothetical protein TNCV_4579511 [Trichonephila clavipes]